MVGRCRRARGDEAMVRNSLATWAAGGAVAVVLAVAVLPTTGMGRHQVGYDSTLEVTADAVVLRLGDERNPTVVLEGLYRLGIRHIDVVETRGEAQLSVVANVRRRVDINQVIELDTDNQ